MTETFADQPFAPALDNLTPEALSGALSCLGAEDIPHLTCATRVLLRRGDTERVLLAEQGIYLSIRDPASDRVTMRCFEGPPLGEVMLVAVADYLGRGFDIVDWTLAEPLDPLESRLLEELRQGRADRALEAAREALVLAPEDARMASLATSAAVALRGHAHSVTLSQRALALAEEPAWALRQHAALLYGAGHRLPCLGVLLYLRENYSPHCMRADAWELLARCFVEPIHRPALVEPIITQGLEAYPESSALLLLRARARLDAGDVTSALEVLEPMLAAPLPDAGAFVLALQALLEGGLEGAAALADRAVKAHPSDHRLAALSLEVADRPGATLNAYRSLLESPPTAAEALDLRLAAMRAALRVGAYEDALRLAREAQARIGEPDPRCLAVMYDSLRALEPSEERDDLAEMVSSARRSASKEALPRGVAVRAQLAAGIYLDPDLLDPLWEELAPEAAEPESLKPLHPSLAEGLLCVATRAGFVTMFDELGIAHRLQGEQRDWYADAELLHQERDRGSVAVGSGQAGVLWVRVTTSPLHPTDQGRFRSHRSQPLLVPSGKLLLGPGEALQAGASRAQTRALVRELGGRSFYLAPARYRLTVHERTQVSWPIQDVQTDPCDVIFQLEKW